MLATVLLAGCAAGVIPSAHTPGPQGLLAGFWRGLWHGLIVPVTFVISLFSDHVRVYEVHNSGGWYDFGFVLGLSIIFGGPSHGAARSRRRSM